MSNLDSAIEHARILLNNLLEMKNNMHPVPVSEEANKLVLLGDESDNNNPEFSFIQPPIPKPPCRLLLVGSSNCGKTNAVLNLITRFWIYPNSDTSIFDEVYILTPTALSDPKLRVLAYHPDLKNKVYLTDTLDIDLIDSLLARKAEDLENKQLPNTLVFIDGFCADKRNAMSPSIVNLFFRGRHSNISVVINSQYYFNVPPSVRTNASGVMIFRLKRNNAELALIRNELSTPKIHDELFDEVLHKAQAGEMWNFLFIDNNTQKFYRNFSVEYALEGDDHQPLPPVPETAEAKDDDLDEEIKKQITKKKDAKE